MTRVIYNRVGKAGSSELFTLLTYLASRNNFTLQLDGAKFANHSEMLDTFKRLPDNHVYVNHCQYIEDKALDGYVWINMVREPIEREVSLYYYYVSPMRRNNALVEIHNRERTKENPCGCNLIEFDDCYRYYIENPICSDHLKMKVPQTWYFTNVNPDNGTSVTFSADSLYRRVRDDYTFVGIIEEWELSVKIFERLLPRFFAGGTNYVKEHTRDPHVLASPEFNPLTNTTKKGAISGYVKDRLSKYNPEQIAFYEHMKRLFWLRVGDYYRSEILHEHLSKS